MTYFRKRHGWESEFASSALHDWLMVLFVWSVVISSIYGLWAFLEKGRFL